METTVRPRSWLPYSVTEGLARAGGLSVVKALGISLTTIAEGAFATLIIGLVQACGGAALGKTWRAFWLGPRFFAGCVMFGVLATVQTIVPFMAFHDGAPLALFAFIVVGLSIIPATVLDVLIFRTRLTGKGWFGVCLAALAGYLMLGAPSLHALLHLKPWVALATLAMLAHAANQAVVRYLSTMPLRPDAPERGVAQNAQVGLVTALLCAALLLSEGPGALPLHAFDLSFLAGAVAAGLAVVLVIGAGIMAYALGANIPLSKTVATAVFLLSSALVGWVFFGEALSFLHAAGLLLFIFAFALIRGDTRESSHLGG